MLKRVARRVLSSDEIAPFLRWTLRPLAPCVPNRVLFPIPLAPIVTARLPGGGTMRYGGGKDRLAQSLFWHGYRGHEPETMDLVHSLINTCSVMLDIGASSGIFAIAAALTNPSLIVHAFEPVPRIFELLQRNLRLNDLCSVTAHPSAVSDRIGSLSLYVPPGDFPAVASLRPGLCPGCDEIAVQGTTIDCVVDAHQLPCVDLMKIDTETTEPEVLQGGRRALARFRPLIICEVLKGSTEDGLHDVLDTQDYRYYWITRRGLEPRRRIEGDPACHERNYLFVPEEKVGLVARIARVRL